MTEKKARLFCTDFMDVSPEDISSEINVYDTFSTFVLLVGGMRITMFLKTEEEAHQARANVVKVTNDKNSISNDSLGGLSILSAGDLSKVS